MKLNRQEIEFISGFFRNKFDDVPGELLEKIEIGFWVPLSGIRLPGLDNFLKSKAIGLFTGLLEPQFNFQILEAFKENKIPYLLIRVDASWQCFIHCNGQIFEQTCEEDKDATTACCMALRSKCESS